MSLQFDQATHTYTLDGAVLPSVTQVLQDVGIINYSFIPDAAREHYMQRGTAVHVATHYDDDGDLKDATVSAEIRPYLMAWRKFRAESLFTPILIEHRWFNRTWQFAGCLDRLGTFSLSMESNVLLDIKSGKSPDWVRYQLAAYASFFESPARYRRIAVELHEDGTYEIKPEFPCRELRDDLQVFLSALTVYRAKPHNRRKEQQAA
jgi:hypothetical protein